jgi:hypothetical protein
MATMSTVSPGTPAPVWSVTSAVTVLVDEPSATIDDGASCWIVAVNAACATPQQTNATTAATAPATDQFLARCTGNPA